MKNDSDTFDDELEALIARIFSKGNGNYKGKLPIIYFSCNKGCHISTRYLDKDERKERKQKGRRDDQDLEKNKD